MYRSLTQIACEKMYTARACKALHQGDRLKSIWEVSSRLSRVSHWQECVLNQICKPGRLSREFYGLGADLDFCHFKCHFVKWRKKAGKWRKKP